MPCYQCPCESRVPRRFRSIPNWRSAEFFSIERLPIRTAAGRAWVKSSHGLRTAPVGVARFAGGFDPELLSACVYRAFQRTARRSDRDYRHRHDDRRRWRSRNVLAGSASGPERHPSTHRHPRHSRRHDARCDGRRRGRLPRPAQKHSALPTHGRRGPRRQRDSTSTIQARAASTATASAARLALTWATTISSPNGSAGTTCCRPASGPGSSSGCPTPPAQWSPRNSTSWSAAQQLHRLRHGHDRHIEGRPCASRQPMRHRAGRQFRGDSPALCRRLLQHGRAGRTRRSRASLPPVRRQSQRLRDGRRGRDVRARTTEPRPRSSARRSTPKCSAAGCSATAAT